MFSNPREILADSPFRVKMFRNLPIQRRFPPIIWLHLCSVPGLVWLPTCGWHLLEAGGRVLSPAAVPLPSALCEPLRCGIACNRFLLPPPSRVERLGLSQYLRQWPFWAGKTGAFAEIPLRGEVRPLNWLGGSNPCAPLLQTTLPQPQRLRAGIFNTIRTMVIIIIIVIITPSSGERQCSWLALQVLLKTSFSGKYLVVAIITIIIIIITQSHQHPSPSLLFSRPSSNLSLRTLPSKVDTILRILANATSQTLASSFSRRIAPTLKSFLLKWVLSLVLL